MKTVFKDLMNTIDTGSSFEPESLRKIYARRGLLNFAGKVCEQHPNDEGARYVSNGVCVACHREKSRKTYREGKKKKWTGEPAPQAHKLNALWPVVNKGQVK